MKYKCIIKYDGSNFFGFQTQKNLRTIQIEIENVLEIITKTKTKIIASGRTDTKVHAIGQVICFDTDIIMEEWQMKNALNTRLPSDIYVQEVSKVSDSFHPRFDAVKKEYHYLISRKEYDPFKKNYMYQLYKHNYDIEKMKECASVFIGTFDFKSFCKTKKNQNTIRTIYTIDFTLTDDVITIKFVGNGFLHNMVRILVAMLFEAGLGKYSKKQLETILAQKNRQFAPKLAPPNGLYLYKVYY